MTASRPPGPRPSARHRLRVELLATLQACLDAWPSAARRLRRALPGPLVEAVARRTAPVRVPGASRARVPTEAALELESRSPPPSGPAAEPGASLLLATWNQWAHTRLCLASIRAFTDPGSYEVIVADDGSSDETAPRLDQLRATWPALRVLAPGEQRGFAAAINRAARQARGRTLVILNNDVVVTPGWLPGLASQAARPGVGLVGPATNDSGDVATRPARYQDLDGLMALAAELRARRGADATPVAKLSLFCAAVPRAAYEAVGGLDEGYGLGLFEDDDLCQALARRGLAILLADGVFVHHTAGATFRTLPARRYLECFEAGRARFERKWATRWAPPLVRCRCPR